MGRKPGRFIAGVALAALASAADAQETPPKPVTDADRDKRLEEVEARNRELEARLDALESGALPQDVPNEGEAVETLGLGLSTRRGDIWATLQLFFDVNFTYDDPEREDRGHAAFGFGQMNAFFTARIGEHFHVLSETVIKTRETADEDSIVFDQERLYGSWSFSDLLYAKFGLEHSPVSRWNRLYHHGRWLETTIDRPFLARFEGTGGILPMHQAGLELGGSLNEDFGEIEWLAAVSNGRGDDPTHTDDVSDSNDAKALDFGLGFSPADFEGFRVGGNLHFDDIPEDDVRTHSIGEFIPSASVEYRTYPFEAIGEWALIAHDDRSTDEDYDSQSAYAQVGYHVGEWMPYTRFDWKNMDQGDPFYEPLDRDLDRWEQILGIRYELLSNVAIKFEVGVGRAEERDDTGDVSEDTVFLAGVQLSWVF